MKRIFLALLLFSGAANAALLVDFDVADGHAAGSIHGALPYYTNGTDRIHVRAFDGDTALFSDQTGGPTMYGGAGVYGAGLTTKTDRFRIQGGSLQMRPRPGYGAAGIVFDISVAAGSVTNVHFGLTKARQMKILIKTDSGYLVTSDDWLSKEHSIADLTTLGWQSYAPGSFTDDVAGSVANVDMTWVGAISGPVVSLSASDTISKIGFSWLGREDVGVGLNNEGLTLNQFQVEAIPEPASIGLILASGGGLLWIRRRFMI